MTVDNRHASIGTQINAERLILGGETLIANEREHLRGEIARCFAAALHRGVLGLEDDTAIAECLRRLLAGRSEWVEPQHMLSLTVDPTELADLYLPLECVRRHGGESPALIRCALASTATRPEEPSPRREGGRIVLAFAGTRDTKHEVAILAAIQGVCHAGMHAFNDASDYLSEASPSALKKALAASATQPGAAVLHLVCPVRPDGLVLHDPAAGPTVVGALSLGAQLAGLAPHLRLVVITPFTTGDDAGDHGAALVEAALALHREGIAAVVAPRMPLPAEKIDALTSSLWGAALGDARTPPSSLEAALAVTNAEMKGWGGLLPLGLRLYACGADGDDTRPFIVRPYRGLLAFEERHARFYVGREVETRAVLTRIDALAATMAPRLVLLVGASGVGKSSLVKAGVVPALVRRGGGRQIFTRPTEGLTRDLEDPAAGRRILLVDQLEELVTGYFDPGAASLYLQRLWSLASGDDGSVVLATLRIDALNLGGQLIVEPDGRGRERRTLEGLVYPRGTASAHAIFVEHLGRDALARVICEPAVRVGLAIDAGIVERLCDEAAAEPGALPMLELALDTMWAERDGRHLRSRAHEGLAGILARHANSCVNTLLPAVKAHARRILVRVATGEEVARAAWRRRSTVEALRPIAAARGEEFDSALAALVDSRLLVVGETDPLARDEPAVLRVPIDLAHELLLRRWDELQAWIEEDRPVLRVLRQLDAWVTEHRARGTLLTDEQIAHLERARLPEDDIGDAGSRLIVSSRRDARRRRWLRRLAFGVLGLASLTVMVLAWWVSRVNAHLVTQGLEHAGDFHMEAREFDFAAMYFAQALVREDTPELRGKLVRAAAEPAPTLLWSVSEYGPSGSDAISTDGTVIVGETDDIVHVYSTRSGARIRNWPIPSEMTHWQSKISNDALNPQGDLIALRAADHVSLVDLSNGAVIRHELTEDQGRGGELAWSQDGSRLVLSTCRQMSERHCVREGLLTLGNDLATIGHIDIGDRGQEGGTTRSITSMAVNRDGSRIAVTMASGRVIVQDAEGSVIVSLQPDQGGDRGNPVVIFDGAQNFLLGGHREFAIVSIDANSGDVIVPILDPTVAARIGALRAALRMEDGGVVLAGCRDKSPFRHSSCHQGLLMRVTVDGQLSWETAAETSPAALAFDGDELLVLGRESVRLLRIDAKSGERRDVAIAPLGWSSDGKDQRAFVAEGALVSWTNANQKIEIRVWDADDGALKAFGSRSMGGHYKWVELLENGDMLVMSDEGVLYSFGKYGLGERSEIIVGVPPRHETRGLFAASAELFVTVDNLSTAQVFSMETGLRRSIDLETDVTAVGLVDEGPALLAMNSLGVLTQYDIETGIRVHRWSLPPIDGVRKPFFGTGFNGSIAVTTEGEGLTLLDLRSGARTDRRIGPGDRKRSGLAVSDDGTWSWHSFEASRTSELVRYEDYPSASGQRTEIRLAGLTTLPPQLVSMEDGGLRLYSWGGRLSAWSIIIPPVRSNDAGSEARDDGQVVIVPEETPDGKVALRVTPTARPDRSDLLLFPPELRPGTVNQLLSGATLAASPDARYVVAAFRDGIILWDTAAEQRFVLNDESRELKPQGIKFDADGGWLVFKDAEDGVRVVRLPVSEPVSRASRAEFLGSIDEIWPLGGGRFLFQENKRSLRIYDAARDVFLSTIRDSAAIADVIGIDRAEFLVLLVTGETYALSADGGVLTTGTRFYTRGPSVCLLRREEILIAENGLKGWDLWSIVTGDRLATMDLGSGLRRQGEHCTAEGLSNGTSARLPFELIGASPERIVEALATRHGLEFDGTEVKRGRPIEYSLGAVPETYVVD